ncbi:hypothetical protein GCM10014713_43450 [Streptomyces purpureus]|uniref:Uncharacterized protein n=1 Tax=Streptomyces purpureus TaxID=1951 RepID=A0A918LSY6_9ACTN|nr:hypothetical protein GCM10014713_43450 [Streptomyces purpureus]
MCPRLPDHPSSFPPSTDNRSVQEGAAYEHTGAGVRKLCHVKRINAAAGWGLPTDGQGWGLPTDR